MITADPVSRAGIASQLRGSQLIDVAAQPGTPITASGDNATSATAPANFMLPPNAYELTLTSRNSTNDLVLDGTVSWP